MDFLAEYEEFKTLPVHIGVTYKFFSQFKVDDENRLCFGGFPSPIPIQQQEVVDALKKFLKATRKEIKEGTMSKDECSRRMWFWYAKLLDLGLSSLDQRQDILRWMDICGSVLL